MNESNLFGAMQSTKLQVMDLLKKTVRPEFLNRIDDIIMFRPLMQKDLLAILDIQIRNLNQLLAANEIQVELTPKAKESLAAWSYDPQFGARPMKRVIHKELVNALSKEILGGQVEKGKTIFVDAQDGRLVFGNVGVGELVT